MKTFFKPHLCPMTRRLPWVVVAAILVWGVTIAQAGPIKAQSELVRVRAVSLADQGGEENWSSLRVLPDHSVLIGLSSRQGSGVLLRAQPKKKDARITTVMRLDEAGYLGEDQRQPKIHVTPVPGPEGGYYFLSHFGMDTHLPLLGSRQGYEGTRLWRWHPQEGGESLGLVKRHDGVVGLAAANSGETLYATTFPRGLMLRIDAETGGVSDLGRVNGVYAPRHMLIGPNQRAWTLDHAGRFWWASSDNERVSPTKARLPVTSDLPGKLLAQGFVSSVAADDQRRHFAVTAWGALYRIDLPAKKGRPPKIKALGRPARVIGNNADRGPRATIAGLALGADGWLYMAVSGYNRAVDRSGDSYLIRCRPDGSNAQQLARLDGEVISYLAGCGAVDQQRGRVYFVGCHLDNDSPHLLIINTDSDKERVR